VSAPSGLPPCSELALVVKLVSSVAHERAFP
jgi:hypothetical protein